MAVVVNSGRTKPATGRMGRRGLSVALVLGLVIGTTFVVPQPAEAKFTTLVAFDDPAVSDMAGTFVPDGADGWVGVVMGADVGGDFPYATARRATISATGAMSSSLLWRNAVEFEGSPTSWDVAPDGSIFLSYRDGNTNPPYISAYGPTGAALFEGVTAGPGIFSKAFGGFLDDGRIYTVVTNRPVAGDANLTAKVYDRTGALAFETPLPDASAAPRTDSTPDGFMVNVDDSAYEFDVASQTIVRSAAVPAQTSQLLRRGDVGYFGLRTSTGSGDVIDVLDRNFSVVRSVPIVGADSYLTRMATSPDGSAAVAWPTGSGTTGVINVQNMQANGDLIGDVVTRAMTPPGIWPEGPGTITAGGPGQSLAGWYTETGARAGRDRDAYVFDSSVDAVSAVIDVQRTYESVRGGWAGYAELITFDGSASSGLPGDEIVNFDWKPTPLTSGAVWPIRIGGSTDRPEYAFPLPNGTRQTFTVTLKVTTRSGASTEATRTFDLAGPAAAGFARLNAPPEPADLGGAVPGTGYTEQVVLENSAAHDIAAAAAAETTVEWSDPSAVDLASVTGDTTSPALGAYRPPTGDLGTWTPDATDGPHMRSLWTWTPRRSGTFDVTFTTNFVDPANPGDRRTATASRSVVLNGARVETTVQAGFDDSTNPGTIAVNQPGGPTQPGEFTMTFTNTGYGDADVKVTLPTIKDYDLAVDQTTFTVAAGASVDRTVTVTTSRVGPLSLPVSTKVTDAVTGNVTGEYSTNAYLNAVSGFEWSVPDRLIAPGSGEIPDLPDTPGERDDVVHSTYPVDVTLTEAEGCEATIDWTITRLVEDDEGNVTRTDVVLDPDERTDCTFRFNFAEEGTYEYDVSIDAVQVAFGVLEIQDVLWVVLGDSALSGEGNPDVPQSTSGVAQWVDDSCNRSINSGAARAAYAYEEASEQSSVTLVHLACSGATVQRGLLGPQQENEVLNAEANPSQLDVLDALIGDRVPDVTVLSIGGNDVLFGPVLTYCAKEGDISVGCPKLGFSENRDIETRSFSLVDDWKYPTRLDPFTGQLCLDYAAGTSRISTKSLTLVGGTDYTYANPNQGEDWEVIINARGTNYSTRNPFGKDDLGPGSSGAETFTALESTSVDCFDAFGAVDGFRVNLDAPTSQNHYTSYTTPGTKVIDITPRPGPEDVELVKMTPQTLDERMVKMVGAGDPSTGLSVGYDALAARLEQIGVPAESVLAMEYYDPLRGDDGETCERILGPDIVPTGSEKLDDAQRGFGLLRNESEWAQSDLLGPLNREFTAAADRAGWEFVGGIAGAYSNNGYCATNPYVVTLGASISQQGDPWGTMHPNTLGHDVISDYILRAVDGLISDPTTFGNIDPTVAGQIVRAIEAGSTAIALTMETPTAAAPTAAAAPTTLDAFAAVNGTGLESRALPTVAAVQFEVGDWVTVGAGNIEATLDGQTVVFQPEIREVVEVTPEGIVVAPALDGDHLLGETVVKVPDRSLVSDPYVPTDPSDVVAPTDPGGSAAVTGDGTSSTPSGQPTAGTLPVTGASVLGLVALALASILAGVALWAVRRRHGQLVS